MFNTLITHLQLFGIGFGFGIIGPCLLVCGPILITYIAGTKRRLADAFWDIVIFLLGRISAYAVLGYLAGLSANLLKQFTNPRLASFFKPAAGIISIFFAIYIILNKEFKPEPTSGVCPGSREPTPGVGFGSGTKIYNAGGLLALGFLIGMTPCGPLIGLLLEIVLISKGALDGAGYALSFGLGTFLSGLIVIGGLSGILAWIPSKIVKSRTADRAVRIACAILLILLGVSLIL